MADALGSESVDGVPDRLRAGRLPRMRHAVQAGVPGDLEGPGELRARHLGTAEPQTDESGGSMPQHELHGLDGKLGPAAAVDVGAPAQPHAVLGLDLGATLLDPLEQRLGCDATPDMTDRGDRDLRVADVLGRQRRAKLPGDQGEILPAPQVTADQQVDLEEVGEVAEAVQLPQALLAAGQPTVGLGPGERQQRRRRDRPLQMQVQLDLRQGVDEPGEPVDGCFVQLGCSSRKARVTAANSGEMARL